MLKKAATLMGVFIGAWAVMAGAMVLVWYAASVAGRIVGWLP